MVFIGVGMQEYDFVIIGSGFGGAVSACRLTQKGYKVVVLEKGRDYQDNDFPKTNWNLSKFLWAPFIKCFGIQSISLLKNLMVLHGVGVGGGSLVYANTLLRPEKEVLENIPWPSSFNLGESLSKHYSIAEKMLGVTENTFIEDNDKLIYKLSEKLQCEDTFSPTKVGVLMDTELGKEVEDPYFSGEGPKRTTCTKCGGCMIGCRVGAKNTLTKNYLYFARKWGCLVRANTQADKIQKISDGYIVSTHRPGSVIFKNKTKIKARNIILSAGVMGTLSLLFKNRDQYKTLPKISSALGENIRTNGESLLGVTSFDMHRDLSKGIAIGASIKPDKYTKIEGVRYPKGSDFMKLLVTPLTDSGNRLVRPFLMLKSAVINLIPSLKALFLKDWSSRTIILLVMQSIDKKMIFKYKRTIFKGFRKGLVGSFDGDKMETSIPIAQESAKIIEEEIGGIALNCSAEAGLGSIATAHILGGALMGDKVSQSVVNDKHELHGYKGFYVCDASVIPGNLAVNPSLTITALAEQFSSNFKNKENNIKEIRFSH